MAMSLNGYIVLLQINCWQLSATCAV